MLNGFGFGKKKKKDKKGTKKKKKKRKNNSLPFFHLVGRFFGVSVKSEEFPVKPNDIHLEKQQEL